VGWLDFSAVSAAIERFDRWPAHRKALLA